MNPTVIVVKAAFDDDSGVWFVEHSEVPGLNVEAETFDELVRQVPLAIADLIREGAAPGHLEDVPIELIAHASARARVRDVA